ncbi:MAG: flagellin [Candidatus Gastranaerophilales bacterium]|nr:flagellin [Candidatus Gastranaerophilales bacterium]
MPITLGTNIAAYSTRMQLNKVTDGLGGIFQKLSTGQRINKAGDDAAGLVISQNMEAKILGSKQAMQNIQTAKSFLTIAEDGMVTINDHFQRINDLLTNMANDTNDIDSRTAAIREIIERLNEINRIAESTNFNGMSMLDGSVESIVVQMGPDFDQETSALNISSALTDCHVSSFNAELPENLDPDVLTSYEVTVDGVKRAIIPNPDTSSTKKWVFADDGEEYEGSDTPTERIIVRNPDEFTGGYVYKDTLEDDAGPTKYAGKTDGLEAKSFKPTNVNCRAYMATIQSAISKIATQRGLLGAYENRMESSYDSLTTRVESLESAKLPYTDTDIAQEATSMTRSQILQQVNVAVLSNSNITQQLALSLLGG